MKILKKNQMKIAELIGRVLLGLLMLVSGLLKLFVQKPEGVTGFLSSLGFPVAAFFAWILIFSEIVFGIAILANYKLQYTVIPPMIILLVALISTNLLQADSLTTVNWSGVFLHLVAVSSYWMYGVYASGK